jgi:Domain of unknown function (DUF3786)
MPRIDDYKQARDLARKQLLHANPDLVARFSGAAITGVKESGMILSLLFLNRRTAVTWGDFRMSFEGNDEEVPIQQQILLLHYLQGAGASGGAVSSEEWISFQEVPDGRFYIDAFQRRAKVPLIQAFGSKPERLPTVAAEIYNARAFDRGDFSVVVQVLPLVPVALVLWRGDEEFPPEGNILFDRTISKLLSAEDIAWLAGMVVYPLVGKVKNPVLPQGASSIEKAI